MPRPLLERALGVRRDDPDAENPIYDDAKEHLFERSVLEAVREKDLDVLQIPRPGMDELRRGRRRHLPRDPAAAAGRQAGRYYATIPFEITIDEVDDAAVDKVVEQLRDQQASLVPVEGRGAARRTTTP